MSFLFGSTSVMYVLSFLLCLAAVVMLLLLYMLVMRSPPPTVIVQMHFVVVAPDGTAAGRIDQMQEQNDAEVAEWETPVQETGQRTRSVMVAGTVTAPDLPAKDQGQEEPNDDAEDTDAECSRTPVQETQCAP